MVNKYSMWIYAVIMWTQKMWEDLQRSSAKQALNFYAKRDPELDLYAFCAECLNSVKDHGVEYTVDKFDVSLGFLMNLEKSYLKNRV